MALSKLQSMHAPPPGRGGGGGGTLIYKTYVGGFQKNEDFWGYEDFVDIFFGSSQNWIIFRGYFYAF